MQNLKKKSSISVEMPIIEALKKYKENPALQFHIPGHTKGSAVLSEFEELIGKKAVFLDSTDEFNNLGTLHPATGAIKQAQELAAKAFGAKKSFFLVGGSTIGNLAIAMTLTKESQTVIVGRNAHRSIITGVINSGAKPVWAIPKKIEKWGLWGQVCANEIDELLSQNPNTSLVWVTSPTYEGIVSDIEEISKVCKKYKVRLAVDEAHGCLWNFHDDFPSPAMQAGADIVVQSLHKTGGSFAQSSIMHVAPDSDIDLQKLESNLRLLHTTSPSYTMLASLDAARAFLQSDEGQKHIQSSLDNADCIRGRFKKISNVSFITQNDLNLDKTKIFFRIDGLSGLNLEDILLNSYNIEVESAADEGVLVLSNIGNKKKEIEYLCECVESIANSNVSQISQVADEKIIPLCIPKMAMTPRDAHQKEIEHVEKEDAIGRVCAEVIAKCPPGISILIPGEVIEEKHLPYLNHIDEISVIID